jgi:hypothetical protein
MEWEFRARGEAKMRSRSFVVFLVTAVVAATGLTTAISRGTRESIAKDNRPVGTSNVAASLTVSSAQDPEEVIDGEKAPDKIPDKVAYTLLLRFLANRKTEAEKNSARSYLRMIFGCDTCPDKSMTKEQRVAAHANIEKLLAAAEDFDVQNRPFDDQAKKIRERAGSNRDLSVRTQLKNLQTKKEALVTQIMSSLPDRLGADGAERLHRFITEQFKRRVKIHPGHKPNQTGALGNAA